MPNLDVWAPRVLSLLRIVTALLFMEHGLMKLLHFPAPQPGGQPGGKAADRAQHAAPGLGIQRHTGAGQPPAGGDDPAPFSSPGPAPDSAGLFLVEK